ncbi:MAG: hypothetical protein PF545_07750, partial [Elusimicrobia bacterium]|nr:hypothetical protein [Elusimicrobiota bacterium]
MYGSDLTAHLGVGYTRMQGHKERYRDWHPDNNLFSLSVLMGLNPLYGTIIDFRWFEDGNPYMQNTKLSTRSLSLGFYRNFYKNDNARFYAAVYPGIYKARLKDHYHDIFNLDSSFGAKITVGFTAQINE